MNKNNNLYYLHNDLIDTTRAITNASGTPVWTLDINDAFSNSNLPTGSLEFNPRFMGQYYDSETDLSYNYYRYYSNELGRYIQSDPIGLAGGWNTYSYVENETFSAVDPLGLKPVGYDNCIALLKLIDYEDSIKNDLISSPFLRKYHFASGFLDDVSLLSLNASFDSIGGKVDIDWMIRSMSPIGPLGYYVGKPYWNIVNMVVGNTKKISAGMDEEGHKNSVIAATYYINNDIKLKEMFSPAIKNCECIIKK